MSRIDPNKMSSINIDGFIENVVRMFQNKSNHKMVRDTFQKWLKLYYDKSVASKTRELDIRKRHNYNLVKQYFEKWKKAQQQKLDFDNYLEEEEYQRNTNTSLSNYFRHESRITRYEDKLNTQENENISKDISNINQDVYRNDTLGLYPIQPFNKQFRNDNSWHGQLSESALLDKSDSLRMPYKSNVETVESVDMPLNRFDDQEIKPRYQKLYNEVERPSYGSNTCFNMPLQSVIVRNNKNDNVTYDQVSNTQSVHKLQLTAIPLQNSIRVTLSQEYDSISDDQKRHILK